MSTLERRAVYCEPRAMVRERPARTKESWLLVPEEGRQASEKRPDRRGRGHRRLVEASGPAGDKAASDGLKERGGRHSQELRGALLGVGRWSSSTEVGQRKSSERGLVETDTLACLRRRWRAAMQGKPAATEETDRAGAGARGPPDIHVPSPLLRARVWTGERCSRTNRAKPGVGQTEYLLHQCWPLQASEAQTMPSTSPATLPALRSFIGFSPSSPP